MSVRRLIPRIATLSAVLVVATAAAASAATFTPLVVAGPVGTPVAVQSETSCTPPAGAGDWIANVSFAQGTDPQLGYADLPVDSDGRWHGNITVPAGAVDGEALLLATCFDASHHVPDEVRYDAQKFTVAPSAFAASTSALSFGYRTVGSTSPAQTVTVTSVGVGALTIGSVSILGDDPSDFAITSDSCAGATRNSGNICRTAVTFRPTARGARSATLVFHDNAPDGPHRIPLSGTGCRLVLPGVPLLHIGAVCL